MLPWYFAAFRNGLLGTILPNFVTLTRPNLQILSKSQTQYFQFLDFWSILYQKSCHNSRISYDIDMKFGPVTKIPRRNKTTSEIWRLRHFGKLWASLSSSQSFWLIWSNAEIEFRMHRNLIGTSYLRKLKTEQKNL